MKKAPFIYTLIVLITFTVDSLAQKKKLIAQNLDTSKNKYQTMTRDSSVIHVFAKWKVKEDQLENVKNILKTVHDKSVKENGNLFYKVYQSKSESNTIILFEGYSNENALETHKRSLHYQEYVLKRIIPLLENREVVITPLINL